MAARSNDIRRLLNAKADKISFKKGAPIPSEGRNGDFTVRTIETKGIKLFVKDSDCNLEKALNYLKSPSNKNLKIRLVG